MIVINKTQKTMSFFPNQSSQNYNPYLLLPPALAFPPFTSSQPYYYFACPPSLLQHCPTIFSPFGQSHYQSLGFASFPRQDPELASFQEKQLPLENQEKEPERKNQKRQECVKGCNGEQMGQLAQDMVSKSGNDRFIKKNTESNIINQIFSFLWSPQKSQSILRKIPFSEHQTALFYSLMRALKTHCKSKLSRTFLKQLTVPSGWNAMLKKLKKKLRSSETLQIDETSCVVRKLVLVYLREVSRYSIMTSKKMNRRLWNLHFKKCHEIGKFLFGGNHF